MPTRQDGVENRNKVYQVTVRAFLFRLIPDSNYGHLTFIEIGLFSLRRLQQTHKMAINRLRNHTEKEKKIQLSYEENRFRAWVTCAGTATI